MSCMDKQPNAKAIVALPVSLNQRRLAGRPRFTGYRFTPSRSSKRTRFPRANFSASAIRSQHEVARAVASSVSEAKPRCGKGARKTCKDHVAGVGDFLGNGRSDLVLENTVTGEHVLWILNNGAPQYSIELPAVSASRHIARAADFDGDGQADLWENILYGGREIWPLKNGVYSSAIDLPAVPTQWHIVDH